MGKGVSMGERHKNFTWFDLTNYDCLDNFTVHDWRTILIDRLLMSAELNGSEDSILEGRNENAKPNIKTRKYWESVRIYGSRKNNPHFGWYEKQQAPHRVIEVQKSNLYSKTGAIRDATYLEAMLDIVRHENFHEIVEGLNILNETKDVFELTQKKEGKNILREREKIIKKFDFPIKHWFLPYLRINLNASDEQLIENFSHWLALMRAGDTGSVRIKKKDFDDWIIAKALPYFDLLNIAKLDGVRITNHLIGDLLFPDEFEVDLSERIRKVTKPKTKTMFALETFGLLGAQRSEVLKPE
jgi:hypothetical protein